MQEEDSQVHTKRSLGYSHLATVRWMRATISLLSRHLAGGLVCGVGWICKGEPGAERFTVEIWITYIMLKHRTSTQSKPGAGQSGLHKSTRLGVSIGLIDCHCEKVPWPP